MSVLIYKSDVTDMLNKSDRYVADQLRLCDTDKIFPMNEVFIVDDIYECMDLLPTVQSTATKLVGLWIPTSKEGYCRCVHCNYIVDLLDGEVYNYCQNCGSFNKAVTVHETND